MTKIWKKKLKIFQKREILKASKNFGENSKIFEGWDIRSWNKGFFWPSASGPKGQRAITDGITSQSGKNIHLKNWRRAEDDFDTICSGWNKSKNFVNFIIAPSFDSFIQFQRKSGDGILFLWCGKANRNDSKPKIRILVNRYEPRWTILNHVEPRLWPLKSFLEFVSFLNVQIYTYFNSHGSIWSTRVTIRHACSSWKDREVRTFFQLHVRPLLTSEEIRSVKIFVTWNVTVKNLRKQILGIFEITKWIWTWRFFVWRSRTWRLRWR